MKERQKYVWLVPVCLSRILPLNHCPVAVKSCVEPFFSVFGDKTTREKTENYYLFNFAAQTLTPNILTMTSTTWLSTVITFGCSL